MLVTLKEVLTKARANQYAVPGFDCVEDYMVRTILETAEEKHSPVILMCLGMHLAGNGWTYLCGLIKMAAEMHNIPIVLHLDHARDLDLIKQAVDNGFTSVMIDGSELPFEENVALTRGAVEIARPHGVSVEGELGHVGGMNLAATESKDSVLTVPEEVVAFVEQTDVDSLAVSIGTAHGVYESLPNLNIERLKELNAVSQVPLVLHGGSGTPDEQIRNAVDHGISKLNIFADERVVMYRGMCDFVASNTREDPMPEDVATPIKAELSTLVANKLDFLGCSGKA